MRAVEKRNRAEETSKQEREIIKEQFVDAVRLVSCFLRTQNGRDLKVLYDTCICVLKQPTTHASRTSRVNTRCNSPEPKDAVIDGPIIAQRE